MSDRGDVTILLDRLRDGDEEAAEALFTRLYGELRRIAGAVFRGQPGQHTLQPTALVNEAYLKMVKPGAAPAWQDRVHFCSVAARAMRQILVNHARDKKAQKRGGGAARERLTFVDPAAGPQRELEVLEVHDALEKLAELDERQARIAELRLFAGLTTKEIAGLLGVSTRTVEMDWRMAKDHLAGWLDPKPPDAR